jgi:hypothetical protein
VLIVIEAVLARNGPGDGGLRYNFSKFCFIIDIILTRVIIIGSKRYEQLKSV